MTRMACRSTQRFRQSSLLGNLIGVQFQTSGPVIPQPNGQDGIFLGNSSANTIGGPTHVRRRQRGLGKHRSNGIDITQSASTGNLVQGNDVGVDQSGQGFVGNGSHGVEILNAPGNILLDNVISSNDDSGVFIEGMTASGNSIRGNLNGTDAEGDQLTNFNDGVFIIQSPDNTIGGTTPADRNVISANENNGVSLRGPLASGNVVQGNYIGTDPSGTLNLGNITDGVFIQNAPDNLIGGTAPGAGNVISEDRIGVDIETYPDSALGQVGTVFTGGQSDGNVVQGNRIGTDATGSQSLGNEAEGVLIVAGSDNLIGGTTPDSGNIISNNLSNGVGIEASTTVTDPTSDNLVEGNRIGTAVDGVTAMGNRGNGVFVSNAPDNTIGGTASGAGNVISSNLVDGINVTGPAASTSIFGNIIGMSFNRPGSRRAGRQRPKDGVDIVGGLGCPSRVRPSGTRSERDHLRQQFLGCPPGRRLDG